MLELCHLDVDLTSAQPICTAGIGRRTFSMNFRRNCHVLSGLVAVSIFNLRIGICRAGYVRVFLLDILNLAWRRQTRGHRSTSDIKVANKLSQPAIRNLGPTLGITREPINYVVLADHAISFAIEPQPNISSRFSWLAAWRRNKGPSQTTDNNY
ncbi:hypothetical protein BDV32DRAFT_15141 [Aspergillus pseudonomiae]|nr:hypothetical protein BDV32DRAFT_15141 [Aspergillus pseudonomiae]